MCCMCDRVDSLLMFNGFERVQSVGQPSVLLTQAQGLSQTGIMRLSRAVQLELLLR